MIQPALAHPLCPRCGYDLSGPVPDWAEQCPLRGVCPECGLGYSWCEVFFPDRNDLPGFFEHARGGWLHLLRAAWRTWAWTLWPRGFFTRVTVTHRIVPSRLALWLIVLILPLHALASALGAIRHFVFPPVSFSGRFQDTYDLLSQLSAWTYPIVSFSPNTSGGWFPPDLNWHILGTPLYLPATLVLHAMYAAMCLVLPRTLGAARVRKAHVARAFLYGLARVPLLAMFRAARNLWLLAELGFSGNSPGILMRGGPYPVYLDALWAPIPAAALLAWTALWWWAAFGRGWRIERAGFVWLLLSVAAALGAACLAFWADGLWWYWWI